MSPVTQFPDIETAREEAAMWIARTHRGLSADETTALREWSKRPVNRRAMQEMSDVWQGLDVLGVLADLFPREGAASVAVRPASRFRHMGLAAAVLAIAAGAMFVAVRYVDQNGAAVADTRAEPRLQAQAYSSTIGEHRTIRLQDGSELSLNSDTLVEVTFAPTLRSVKLHRGEAHFEVAHDATRPFLVSVNAKTLRAIGTAFNVRRRSDAALEVLVTEGVVSAYEDVITADESERLEAGQLLRVRPDGSEEVTRPSASEMSSLTAWRRGVVVLDGITLEAAMAEVSRYTTQRIVIEQPALRGIRLGGSFPTNDLSEMFRALRANFGIETIQGADGTLRLTKPPDG